MRSLLFWLIFLFSLITVASVLSILSVFNIIQTDSLLTGRIIFPFTFSILISFLFSYIISSRYSRPLNKIADYLDNPSKLDAILYSSKFLPSEIKKILIASQKKQNKNRDIQSELAADKKLFKSILSTMNDGVIITDIAGNVSLINTSAKHIFSPNHENIIGNSLAEALRNHKINELWEKCIHSKHQEMTYFETSPQKSFIQCIATPLDPEMPGNILFIFQDQTRMRQLEIVRRDFVSNVSHELRTPLTSLKLITETLQTGALEDPTAAKMFVDRMDGEVDNLTQMVEELLELSRIESGKVPLEKQWVRPCDLINKNCERMLMQAERAGLSLSYQCNDDLPKINVDPLRIGRVLVNIIHNAIKFTPPGGQIESSAYYENNTVIFFVKDTGVGIPHKDIERIFERFYKADPSRSNHGTGLGLSISKHIVESHGGKIWAESTPALGSKILFNIPLY
ncbi:MAG: ATP-binding protein [Pelolinea sp.]|nr:ATP-binding protein [Pelolinea sp.]